MGCVLFVFWEYVMVNEFLVELYCGYLVFWCVLFIEWMEVVCDEGVICD